MSGMLRMSAADYNAKMLKRKEGRVKNVRKKVVDGIEFASTKEARAWQDYVLQQHAGVIGDLRRQVEYRIDINGMHVCSYFADFVFIRNGREIVADAKGMRTDVYKLKRKLMQAVHGIDIEEV